MKYDIVALGEILIDFAPAGVDDAGDAVFIRKAGGAPLNLLATVAKYGGKTAFIGKVGADMFGDFLKTTLDGVGVDRTYLKTDEVHNTTLAFVALSENGDRSFSFYRRFGADAMLTTADVDPEPIRSSSYFHFGSLSLTNPASREATAHALELAKRAGCRITYDPNYRPPLWGSEAEALEAIVAYLPMADVVKVSLEEAQMITGESDVAACAQAMRRFGNAILLITDGPNGAYYCKDGVLGHVPGMDVRAVDTTGAGDIFFGSFLYELIQSGKAPEEAGAEDLEAFCRLAVRQSGYSVLKKGAIPSIPEYHI